MYLIGTAARLAGVVVFLSGCVTGGNDSVEGPTPGADSGCWHGCDNDFDGYYTFEGDCDDADALINPGALDACADGIDNNCDGLIDNISEDDPRYPDSDGDGYGGDVPWPGLWCTVDISQTWVERAGDCDDSNPAIYPRQTEACNGWDDDCDGLIDEWVTISAYADADGDGYGDPLDVLDVCEVPKGRVADGTDCDDTDRHSFPGAPERCDGADNDCDGAGDSEDCAP